MNIYEKYSDKAIRNKPNQDDLERAFTEMQAIETANKISEKYQGEPRFLTEVVGKLIEKIKQQSPKHNDSLGA